METATFVSGTLRRVNFCISSVIIQKRSASINFSKDSETLATATLRWNNRILERVHTGEHLKTVNVNTKPYSLYNMSYSPDGSTYVCDDDDSDDRAILLYDANTDELLHAFQIAQRRCRVT